jgi:hypothetical protein
MTPAIGVKIDPTAIVVGHHDDGHGADGSDTTDVTLLVRPGR